MKEKSQKLAGCGSVYLYAHLYSLEDIEEVVPCERWRGKL